HGDVELAVGAELQPAAVVKDVARHVVDQHVLVGGQSAPDGEPDHAVDQRSAAAPLHRAAGVEMTVLRELAIERESHQAALAARRTITRVDGQDVWTGSPRRSESSRRGRASNAIDCRSTLRRRCSMAGKVTSELKAKTDAAWTNLTRQLQGMESHLDRSDAPG